MAVFTRLFLRKRAALLELSAARKQTNRIQAAEDQIFQVGRDEETCGGKSWTIVDK